MKITVNGSEQSTERTCLKDLLTDLGLAGTNVVVEIEGEIVAREDHASHPLTEGAVIEIVRFVGGG